MLKTKELYPQGSYITFIQKKQEVINKCHFKYLQVSLASPQRCRYQQMLWKDCQGSLPDEKLHPFCAQETVFFCPFCAREISLGAGSPAARNQGAGASSVSWLSLGNLQQSVSFWLPPGLPPPYLEVQNFQSSVSIFTISESRYLILLS